MSILVAYIGDNGTEAEGISPDRVSQTVETPLLGNEPLR
jgi:hypothetical protein